ncbi:creatininase family protein [Microcoleus asticus]|uniref:creatininase family protein n=1 Tax=Microcoleus asticus TaxID=2815231 RepID=UPI0030D6D9DD
MPKASHPSLKTVRSIVWRVPNVAAELLTAKELEFGIHAGDAETSLMLSILPRSVKMERAVTEYPKNLPIDSLQSMEGNLPFAWLTRELTESGVLGDVTAAKEKGSRILESLSDGWTQVIKDVHKFRQPGSN